MASRNQFLQFHVRGGLRIGVALGILVAQMIAQNPVPTAPVKATPERPADAAIPTVNPVQAPVNTAVASAGNYLLGPDDSVVIRAPEVEEIGTNPYRIDPQGNIRLPLIGRVHAAGLNLDQLEAQLISRLGEFVNEPHVAVSLSGYRSQPISILGAVQKPGVVQLEGQKTLFEVLSLAGGLRQDAGYRIHITRTAEQGKLPLPDAAMDASGQFSVGSVAVKSIMEASNPKENILIKPQDVITVPKGELVFVIGAVKKAGGFVLNEKANISVLTALSFAEGLDSRAAPAKARIMRAEDNNQTRKEIPVDLKKILDGKAPDQPLTPNDVLFVPNNIPKNAALRGLEAALQIGTSLAIYRP
jgi:polysaccharide export outer membrane protein